MSGQQQLQPGDFVATRADDHGNVVSLRGAVADLRAPALSTDADLSNVIPFARARRSEQSLPPLTIARDDRSAPLPPVSGRSHAIALLAGSILLHSTLLLTLWQTPRPMASIGVEAITMEEVLGADTPAGLAITPSENEVQAAAPAEAAKPDDTVVEQQQLKTTEQREIAPEETQRAQVTERREVRPEETRQRQVAVEQREVQPQETRQQRVVAELREVAPQEQPPETPEDVLTEISLITVEPLPDRPDEVKPVARQKTTVQKEANRPKQKAKAAPSPSIPSTASSGVGRGRSDATSNYPGVVVAHLARHKQYPPSARSSGAQGTGSVTFSIDGNGRVTSVSVVRSTGASALDQELTAMVRRASPFPPPPGGQGRSFTAPVSFRIK